MAGAPMLFLMAEDPGKNTGVFDQDSAFRLATHRQRDVRHVLRGHSASKRVMKKKLVFVELEGSSDGAELGVGPV